MPEILHDPLRVNGPYEYLLTNQGWLIEISQDTVDCVMSTNAFERRTLFHKEAVTIGNGMAIYNYEDKYFLIRQKGEF